MWIFSVVAYWSACVGRPWIEKNLYWFSVLPNPRFRHPIGLLLGYFWLPGHEMSWNRVPCLVLSCRFTIQRPKSGIKQIGFGVRNAGAVYLWKIVNFLSIQGDFEPFQRQWADLSSIDRIKTSYGAIEGDYPQLPELDNLSFFCPIGWFLVNLPHKPAQN